MATLANISYLNNERGPVLGYCPDSGVKIIEKDGYKFKNLSRDGKLKPFEDWRLTPEQRATDLAARLSLRQLAGLMLHAGKQSVPGRTAAFLNSYATFDGKEYDDCDVESWTLTDQQKHAVTNEHVRAFLMMEMESVEAAVNWQNNIQVLCENQPYSIPCNNSSNPRQMPGDAAQFFSSDSYYWSVWPEALGLAASFEPALVREYGHTVAVESRALGICTALAPQIDLATEPRWSRFLGTFGESPKLATALARAVCDGMQTTRDLTRRTSGGWGIESIIAMPKHWPGGGTEEGGRDAHHAFGKYSVYPGDNLEQQMEVFAKGAFNLCEGTLCAAAVMPYYDIPWQQDKKYGENVGNNFSRYIVTDLLRDRFGFEGVVCTDFSITDDRSESFLIRGGNCWGVERMSIDERFLKLIEAGVDQFGDIHNLEHVMNAIELGNAKYGEQVMRRRIEISGTRVLTNMFRLGLFENPYLSFSDSQKTVGCALLKAKGIEAQRKSIVLLKNERGLLPIRRDATVYFTKRFIPSRETPFMTVPAKTDYLIDYETISKYFNVTDDPTKADFALFCLAGPVASTGYEQSDLDDGGNGYVPITLQYSEYTATTAREVSLAGGDPLENFTNRSHRNKTVRAQNYLEAELLKQTRKLMGDKPVVTVWKLDRPAVPAQVEPYSDALLVHFGVDAEVMLDLLVGETEPSGLLPCQLPASMDTVEKQCEDVPFDMDCYVDSSGSSYDFAYGMNWMGKITDKRTKIYR